ncbi:hypothetical protein [Taibaiella soli]|uniref:Tetratricopeptide repeat protein n=1 Tax=Taibaiella soli TaxID=1649169 RepID=A0A2W2BGT9_9BACT|nr:hypothetical protein [Taibaiella soli]PZF72706.1 hypothetical protein DN068_12640 [Taibaiella soli]
MKKIVILVAIVFAAGCADIAVSTTETKKPVFTQTEAAKDANRFFWDNFHAGNYDSIPVMTQKLCSALAANPNDLITTAHLGFTHVWAISERQRLQQPDPAITEHVLLARRYFEEAYKMNEKDARILGFLADMSLAEGALLNNKKEQTEGYFMGLKCVQEWPQFNKFTVGYTFSRLPPTDKNFQKGLQWQYESINDCACEGSKLSGLSEKQKTIIAMAGKKPEVTRACLNTWIAPHNFEGFYLNFGDMLVKNGNWKEAIDIYQLAKLSPTFDQWLYKDTLQARISDARENVARFNKPLDEPNLHSQPVMMVNASFACSGCHSMSKNEQINFGKQEPPLSYYFSHK